MDVVILGAEGCKEPVCGWPGSWLCVSIGGREAGRTRMFTVVEQQKCAFDRRRSFGVPILEVEEYDKNVDDWSRS